jgi:hypothetical protein
MPRRKFARYFFRSLRAPITVTSPPASSKIELGSGIVVGVVFTPAIAGRAQATKPMATISVHFKAEFIWSSPRGDTKK